MKVKEIEAKIIGKNPEAEMNFFFRNPIPQRSFDSYSTPYCVRYLLCRICERCGICVACGKPDSDDKTKVNRQAAPCKRCMAKVGEAENGGYI